MQDTAHNLQFIGEYGHGKTTLAISTAIDYRLNPSIFSISKTKHKIFFYSLNLRTGISQSNNSIVEVFNKFDFAETIILDFYAFVSVMKYFHRIKIFQNKIPHLILFNPIKSENLFEQYFGIKFTTLDGEEIRLNKFQTSEMTSFFQTNAVLTAIKIEIINLQDKKASLKLSSLFKNCRIHFSENYTKSIELLHKILDE